MPPTSQGRRSESFWRISKVQLTKESIPGHCQRTKSQGSSDQRQIYLILSGGNIGYSKPYPPAIIKNNTYRKYAFVTSHLRAFYTKLLTNIRDEDFKDKEGNYFKAANDVAICIPILEQSHEKVLYLPQLTYFYNSDTELNNHRIRLKEQKANDKYIRTKPRYRQLKDLFQEPYVYEDKNKVANSTMNLTQHKIDNSKKVINNKILQKKR